MSDGDQPPKPKPRLGSRGQFSGKRVTLDFSGPPLALPGREGREEGDDGGRSPPPTGPERAGRTREVEDPVSTLPSPDDEVPDSLRSTARDQWTEPSPPPETAARPADPVRPSGAGSPAEPVPVADPMQEVDGHDAWTIDRKVRQSTTPPPAAAAAEGRPDPAPTSPPIGRARRSSAPLPASSGGDALGLVDRAKPSTADLDFATEMADRYALGDFTGALQAAELLLGRDPGHSEALRYAESSRERLEQLYSARLGPLSAVPVVAIRDTEARWLGLDHRAAYLLSQVDGSTSLESLLTRSEMKRLEVLKTLAELLDMGVIRLG